LIGHIFFQRPAITSLFCLSVVEEDRSCAVSVMSSPQHITRPSTDDSPSTQSGTGLHCGSHTKPWLLEAPAGQRINISILEFTPSSAAASDISPLEPRTYPKQTGDSAGGCAHHRRQYGYIIDKSAAVANKKNVSICSGSQRVANVYLSSSSSVELVLTSALRGNITQNYLIRIEGEELSNSIFRRRFC